MRSALGISRVPREEGRFTGGQVCRKPYRVGRARHEDADLRPHREDEVGKCNGEYRDAEEESVDDPLHLFFGLSLILRRRHPSANDFSARLVCFHVAGPLSPLFPQHACATARAASNPPAFPRETAASPMRLCCIKRFVSAQ